MARFGIYRSFRGDSTRNAYCKKQRKLSVESLEVRNLLAADFSLAAGTNPLDGAGQQPVSPYHLNAPLPDFSFSRVVDAQQRARFESATHQYYVDGQPQGMVIYSDRIVLGLKPGLMGPQNLQWMAAFGLTEMRPLAGDGMFSVYASNQPLTEEFIHSLTETGMVETVVPVFKMVQSQSEAVLLNEVIISLPNGVDAQTYFADIRFGGYSPLPGTPDQFVATLSAGYGLAALAEINQLTRDPNINWAAPNFHQKWEKYFTPNDAEWSTLWHLHHTGQQVVGGAPGLAGTDVNIVEAWDVKQGSDSSLIIGVLDDGVPAPFTPNVTDHPDLLNYSGDANYGAGPDSNGNGWIGDRNGWDFVNNGFISWPNSTTDRHGTAVGGLAAARGNNGIGVIGGAFGSPILSARMFAGNGVATDANIASAIYYLSGRTFNGLGQWNAATVVNHSWGGGAPSAAINNALSWATSSARGGLGVPQFWASGNSGGSVGYPASQAAVNPGMIVVGAINNAGELTSYHDGGPLLDVVAPSNELTNAANYLRINSTDRRGSSGYSSGNYTGTGSTGFGGTSAASPIAAGVGALAMARASDLGISLTPQQLRDLMRNNTKLAGGVSYDVSNNGHNDLGGKGLLNAGSLLKGIGTAQLSVHSNLAEIQNDSTGWTFGSVFTNSISEVVFRIRNQGTQTLNIASVSTSGDSSYSIIGSYQNSLELGESTTFRLRFHPTTAGEKIATVTIVSNDPTNSAMTFEVSSTATTPDASGYVYEDRNGDGIKQTGENSLSDRRVFLDMNGNGALDTLATTPVIQNTPVVIPSNQVAALTSTLNVAGLANWITDVNVTLNVTHSWVEDLMFVLKAPTGESSILFNRRGANGHNLTNTVFDDSAATAISSGTAPFTGTFRPETPLSVFNGLSASEANGTWTLSIYDFFPEDGGTLHDWTITFGTGETSTQTDAFGFYAFDDLPNGSYSAKTVMNPDWTAPVGAPTSYDVTIPSTPQSDLNFGLGKNNRFYANVFNDTNGNGVQNGGEEGRASRTLFVDGNMNGTFETPADFTSAPNEAIADFPATTDYPLIVSGFPGTVQNMEVIVNLSHTWMEDLSIQLIAPDATNVLLFDRRGGGGDNLVGTIFDDSAPASIASGTAPFTGRWMPESPLSGFNGMDPNGTWFLRIQDHDFADIGTLHDFTLKFNTFDIPFETSEDGWGFVDLASGANDIILTDAGWTFTVPPDGTRSINADGLPLFNQTFGERDVVPASIVDALVNHVAYTGGGSSIDSGKSLAMESDSPTLLTFDNLINSAGGIRGVMFDIADVAGSLAASDFEFQMSPTGAFDSSLNPPSGWSGAPAPSSVTFTPGSPNRVSLEWAPNAIANRWLRITVLPNANTGLTTSQVFYVGHLLGETTGPSGGVFTVAFTDITPVRAAAGNVVDSSSIVDIDKSGIVSFSDIAAMRSNIGAQLTQISIPVAGGGGGSMMAGIPGGGKGNHEFGSRGLAPLVDSSSFRLYAEKANPSPEWPSRAVLSDDSTTKFNDSGWIVSLPAKAFSTPSSSSIRDEVFELLALGNDSQNQPLKDFTEAASIKAIERFFEQFSEGGSLDNQLLNRI